MERISLVRVLIAVCLGLLGGAGVNVRAAEKPAATQPATTKLTDEQLDDLFLKAVMLHKFGRYDEAEAAARQILAERPDNKDVKQLLAEIANVKRRLGVDQGGAALELKLTELIIPEVNFREADPKDVFEFLQQQSAKLSRDKTPINFVLIVPLDAKLPHVTLSLKRVPLLDVLHYVTELTGLRYRIDPHAVVISKPAAQALPAPVPASDANVKPQ